MKLIHLSTYFLIAFKVFNFFCVITPLLKSN